MSKKILFKAYFPDKDVTLPVQELAFPPVYSDLTIIGYDKKGLVAGKASEGVVLLQYKGKDKNGKDIYKALKED